MFTTASLRNRFMFCLLLLFISSSKRCSQGPGSITCSTPEILLKTYCALHAFKAAFIFLDLTSMVQAFWGGSRHPHQNESVQMIINKLEFNNYLQLFNQTSSDKNLIKLENFQKCIYVQYLLYMWMSTC